MFSTPVLDRRKIELYGNLFYLLQTEPAYLAKLVHLCAMSDVDSIIKTVMFTIYGNQYERREELLLLTMFQVC